jgi:plasmid stabilization system protein ParE
MRLEFSLRAERDLEHILDYIAVEAGPESARRYDLKIREKCIQICSAPGMGNRHPIHPTIRKINVGPHKIFYREELDCIIIHRIWDGRRGSLPKLHFPE